MDVVGKFGEAVGSAAREHPKRARALLLAGWWAQLANLTVHAERRLPPSRQYVARVAMDKIVRALAHPERAAAVSLFAPSEVLMAADMLPLSVEHMSCFIGGTKAQAPFLSIAGEAGFPPTMCSYHRVYLGTLESGLVPAPSCVVYTNVACDANMVTFPHIAQAFGIPAYCVDVPYERSEDSVAEVARQIRGLVGFLGEVRGVPVPEERLRECVARGWRSALAYRRFLEKSPGRRLPADMTSEMYAFLTNHILLGSPEAERFCTMLADDMERAAPSSGTRLVWLHTMPFSQEPMIERLNFNDGAFITACDLAADPMLIDVDPARPYEAMARRLVYSCFNGAADARVRRALDMAERTHAVGAVIFNHWGCKATLGVSQLMKRELERAGLPCLALDGDGIDPTARADGQTATRMGAFLEMLAARRGAREGVWEDVREGVAR